MSALESVGGDLEKALEAISVPSYVLDRNGVIRWVNPAAEKLVGDVRGRQFTTVLPPEEKLRAREQFARKVVGAERVTDTEAVLLASDGERLTVEISAVPLTEGHHVVGVFGQLVDVQRAGAPPELPALTPRQAEILHFLEHGKSTGQIAQELHLSPETVRNHVRRLLRTLGVHTRLEAVALARRRPGSG